MRFHRDGREPTAGERLRHAALVVALGACALGVQCRCGDDVRPAGSGTSAASASAAASSTAPVTEAPSSEPLTIATDTPPAWILVADSTRVSGAASYLPIQVGALADGTPPHLGDSFSVATLSKEEATHAPNRPVGELLAAYEYPRFAAVTESTGKRMLELRDLADGSRLEIPIGDAPTALHVHRDELLVATSAIEWSAARPGTRAQAVKLHTVSLASPGEAPRELCRFVEEGPLRKSIDFFVRSGDWVVAVDDVRAPYSAIYFRAAAGAAEPCRKWKLPELVNGHYTHGLVVRHAGDRDAALLLIAEYGVFTHLGQVLLALSVRDEALDAGDRYVSPEWPDPELTLGEEKGDYDPPGPELDGRSRPLELLGGKAFTRWTGLGLALGAPPRIALAAGVRGLLLVPWGPKPRRAELIDVGGACLDVLSFGKGLLALVDPASQRVAERPGRPQPKPSPTTLVTLSWDAAGRAVVERTTLPGYFNRFVQ
ncbi:MAG: hypothetical protein HY908_30420 [Myxococcales bacterium]|nr:hypothetical protein [Myxococcales bacterium]